MEASEGRRPKEPRGILPNSCQPDHSSINDDRSSCVSPFPDTSSLVPDPKKSTGGVVPDEHCQALCACPCATRFRSRYRQSRRRIGEDRGKPSGRAGNQCPQSRDPRPATLAKWTPSVRTCRSCWEREVVGPNPAAADVVPVPGASGLAQYQYRVRRQQRFIHACFVLPGPPPSSDREGRGEPDQSSRDAPHRRAADAQAGCPAEGRERKARPRQRHPDAGPLFARLGRPAQKHLPSAWPGRCRRHQM